MWGGDMWAHSNCMSGDNEIEIDDSSLPQNIQSHTHHMGQVQKRAVDYLSMSQYPEA